MVRCWRGYLSGARCRLAHAQLMPLPLTISCSSKIEIGFTFLVPAHPGSPGQRAVKWVCVRACVCVISYLSLDTWSHTVLTRISPHSIEPQCCFYLRYCLSEGVFSVVLLCWRTILICLWILYAFTASKMTYSLSSGALNSTPANQPDANKS